MRQRPIWCLALAATLVLVALSIPGQIMWIYGHGFEEIPAVLAKLTALNWMVMGGSVFCAGLMWRAAPEVRYALPVLIVVVAVNNFYVGYYATDFSMWAATGATFGFILLNLPVLDPRLQQVFLHPEQRWWLRAARHRLSLPVTVDGTRLQSSKSETFDISESGAFIPAVQEAAVGDWITLRMKFGTFTQLRCQAKVVRRVGASGEYPAGVGVEFVNMSWSERRELKRHIGRAATAP